MGDRQRGDSATARKRRRSFRWWWHVLVVLSALAWGTYTYMVLVELREARRMEQKPLWKIDSGEFAGWRQGNDLYNAAGKHVGYFVGDVAYHLNGKYLGEVMDGEWLARHAHRTPPTIGAREERGSIRSTPRARRSGRPSKMWKEPEL